MNYFIYFSILSLLVFSITKDLMACLLRKVKSITSPMLVSFAWKAFVCNTLSQVALQIQTDKNFLENVFTKTQISAEIEAVRIEVNGVSPSVQERVELVRKCAEHHHWVCPHLPLCLNSYEEIVLILMRLKVRYFLCYLYLQNCAKDTCVAQQLQITIYK